jgi:hypothetical protein
VEDFLANWRKGIYKGLYKKEDAVNIFRKGFFSLAACTYSQSCQMA